MLVLDGMIQAWEHNSPEDECIYLCCRKKSLVPQGFAGFTLFINLESVPITMLKLWSAISTEEILLLLLLFTGSLFSNAYLQ